MSVQSVTRFNALTAPMARMASPSAVRFGRDKHVSEPHTKRGEYAQQHPVDYAFDRLAKYAMRAVHALQNQGRVPEDLDRKLDDAVETVKHVNWA